MCSSRGTTYDFAGFGVSRGRFAFGKPTRYIPLAPHAAETIKHSSNVAAAWDAALEAAACEYDQEAYTLLGSNCHTFVQDFLRSVGMPNALGWSPVYLVRYQPLRKTHCCMSAL